MRRTGLLGLLLSLSCVQPTPGTTPTPTPTPSPSPTASTEHDTRSENSSELEFSGRVDEPSRGEGAVSTGPAILAAHNKLRAEHCAPALTWSKDLEAEAQGWANKLSAAGCAFDHSNTPHGENLSYFRPPGALTQEDIADQWYREVARYDFRHPGFSFEAGHFTQLVWIGTARMGCGSAQCGGGELWVCNYDPPGNMQGAFPANVKPAGCR